MDDEQRIAYLSGDESVPLEASERAELDELRGILKEPASWVEPAPGLENRVMEAVAAAGGEASIAESDSATVVALPVRERPRGRGRLKYAVFGTAAAVIAAVALTISLLAGGNGAVQYAASLTGTALAPNSSGRVTLTQTTSGWRIHLQANGLPRRDNGDYYQAWLKNAAGVLVPIGTFNQSDDVTLWSGAAPSAFPILTVTKESADGNQASSKQVVLAGPTTRTH